MNEFIVWDDKLKKFVLDNDETGREFFINCDGKIFLKTIGMETFGGNIQLEWEINRFKKFPHIGKTDINGKKIYADCSIVKVHDKRSRFFNDICTVKYNKSICSYMLSSIDFEDDSQEHIRPDYANRYYEIIDTIQENKLGLYNKDK